MTLSPTARQAIHNWARKFITAYHLPARQTARLTRQVVRVSEANIVSGRFERFACAQGRPTRAVLRAYVQRVAACVVAEGARIRLLEKGDEAEWQRVQAMLIPRAYYLLCRLCDAATAQAEAADFVNATCEKIFVHMFPFDVAFDAWATTILRNRILTTYRRSPDVLNHERDRLSLDAAPDSGEGPLLAETVPHKCTEEFFTQIENRALLADALEFLHSPSQRRLVQAIYLDGMTRTEFAAREGISPQAVYNLQHRALKTLRKILSSPPQEKPAQVRQSSRRPCRERGTK